MIDKFEVGYFYRWIGPSDFYTNWNDDMDTWKDGEVRKCVDSYSPNHQATFDSNGLRDFSYYYGHVLHYFERVDDFNGQYLLML